MNLKQFIYEVPDFPKKGVLFRDITPLLLDPEAFTNVLLEIAERWDEKIDAIVALDARGFIFGSALAITSGFPLALARKKGKLPRNRVSADYDLEYGEGTLELHTDALHPGMRVLVVDDLLATGGTALAACTLVEKLGAMVAGCVFVIELDELKGRERLAKYEIQTLLHY